MRWTALPCHHGLKSLKPSVNRNLPFLNLSPGVFIKVKKNLTTIWSPFWEVLKEVLETSVWSLSLKKCAGLCILVLWLPGERWDFFISNTFLPLAFMTRYHREGYHCNWADEESPPPLNLQYSDLNNDFLLQIAGVFHFSENLSRSYSRKDTTQELFGIGLFDSEKFYFQNLVGDSLFCFAFLEVAYRTCECAW